MQKKRGASTQRHRKFNTPLYNGWDRQLIWQTQHYDHPPLDDHQAVDRTIRIDLLHVNIAVLVSIKYQLGLCSHPHLRQESFRLFLAPLFIS